MICFETAHPWRIRGAAWRDRLSYHLPRRRTLQAEIDELTLKLADEAGRRAAAEAEVRRGEDQVLAH